ncbi:hypothetical protein HJG53_14870 [Sphingomonas sp. ID1715]|nr:hypothetical protein [Sphingomonas sp. ID1715]NNM78174.1 hypothetical protein [Sphingomonas sp. ID1715]
MTSTTKSDEESPASTAPGYGDQGPAGAGRTQKQEDAAETEDGPGGDE